MPLSDGFLLRALGTGTQSTPGAMPWTHEGGEPRGCGRAHAEPMSRCSGTRLFGRPHPSVLKLCGAGEPLQP